MHTYTAKVLEKLNTVRIRVGVFRVDGTQEELIGEYERNYGLLNTFCYFRQGDREYALYSRNYSATRVMELPSCKDLGGEEPSAGGFCPVDYYVPSYVDRETDYQDGRVTRSRRNDPNPEDLLTRTDQFLRQDEKTGKPITVEVKSYPVTSVIYYPFGFVSGCVWGDDTSWKIQYLDLSKVEEGIIKREERFGYIALPNKMSLRQAINMEDYYYFPDDENPDTDIFISIQKRFNLQTGEMLDY